MVVIPVDTSVWETCLRKAGGTPDDVVTMLKGLL